MLPGADAACGTRPRQTVRVWPRANPPLRVVETTGPDPATALVRPDGKWVSGAASAEVPGQGKPGPRIPGVHSAASTQERGLRPDRRPGSPDAGPVTCPAAQSVPPSHSVDAAGGRRPLSEARVTSRVPRKHGCGSVPASCHLLVGGCGLEAGCPSRSPAGLSSHLPSWDLCWGVQEKPGSVDTVGSPHSSRTKNQREDLQEPLEPSCTSISQAALCPH